MGKLKYDITIKSYNAKSKQYDFDTKFAYTDDIYHIIGFLQCTSISDVRAITYEEIDKIPENQNYYKYDKILDTHIHIVRR